MRSAHMWLAIGVFAFLACLIVPANAVIVVDDNKKYPDYYATGTGKDRVKTQCPGVRVLIDYDIPSEGGAAGRDIILLNPKYMNKAPKAVRLFVFNHECGHTQPEIDDSELLADKYAVFKGVKEGWLDEDGLKQVCDSFEDAPATSSHPSGRTRCKANAKWFAEASKHPEERTEDTDRVVPLKPLPPATYTVPAAKKPWFPWWYRWWHNLE